MVACYKHFHLSIEWIGGEVILVLNYDRDYLKGFWRNQQSDLPMHSFYEKYTEEIPLLLNLLTFFLPLASADRAFREADGFRIALEKQLTDGCLRYRMRRGVKLRVSNRLPSHRVSITELLKLSTAAVTDVTNELQNVMLPHTSINTFVKHYSVGIHVDARAIVRGLPAAKQLLRFAASMSRSIDPRRPYKLDVPPDNQMSPRKHRATDALLSTPAKRQGSPRVDDVETGFRQAMASVCINAPGERSTICFLCVANSKLPATERLRVHSTPGSVTRHFIEKHIKRFPKDMRVRCNVSNDDLPHKSALKNHAERVHGIVSRRPLSALGPI
ncbi:hypothetical protein BDV26DRAFT_297082 [Aspergillus bertholletiae]|uniref:Uncharacterized protein n=1 Tax=Aspergillus bertholletiae TaxID=1226010 RepID=A0A5N7AU90_9EURO|nr:hypothetical protein BDV26DRAFT_297082 [Aspergillus bertholletiae]